MALKMMGSVANELRMNHDCFSEEMPRWSLFLVDPGIMVIDKFENFKLFDKTRVSDNHERSC